MVWLKLVPFVLIASRTPPQIRESDEGLESLSGDAGIKSAWTILTSGFELAPEKHQFSLADFGEY